MSSPVSSPAENAPAENVPVENASAEEAAWAEVVGAWDDEARHRAYLDRFPDLEGLALAGRRYREALAARPGDAVAARFRDEVLKRAMVQGLVSLPRPAPAVEKPRAIFRAILVAVAVGLGAATWWMIYRLGSLSGASP
ncbi:MAG TPA: hypothetical protein VIV57_01715 [Anaeromyxobacter sp.]